MHANGCQSSTTGPTPHRGVPKPKPGPFRDRASRRLGSRIGTCSRFDTAPVHGTVTALTVRTGLDGVGYAGVTMSVSSSSHSAVSPSTTSRTLRSKRRPRRWSRRLDTRSWFRRGTSWATRSSRSLPPASDGSPGHPRARSRCYKPRSSRSSARRTRPPSRPGAKSRDVDPECGGGGLG